MSETLITYKIVSDSNGKLKATGKIACNFWNKFISPSNSIVIRLGVFTSIGSVIARAYKPAMNDGVVYGNVEFNTRFLEKYSTNEIAGTIVHEIGHTLGFGWDEWMKLFDQETGKFKAEYTSKIPTLKEMLVETDYGDGTALAHWDEETFDGELMTGFKDASGEYVLPITIDVMPLLGHVVNEPLAGKTNLDDLLNEVKDVQFSQVEKIKRLDVDFFVKTELWEEIYPKQRKKTAKQLVDPS